MKLKKEVRKFLVKVLGKTIKILRFTDDIALLANTDTELQKALNVTETV